MKRIGIQLFWITLVLWGTTTAQGQEAQPGQAGFVARASHLPSATSFASSRHSNRLMASQEALSRCRAARPVGACEIVGFDDGKVTTSAEIRASLPAGPRDLYLWQYEKAGSIVFLAGSIHLLKPGFYPLPPQYEKAFERSDALVLEIDTERYDAAQVQAQTLSVGRLPPPTTLRSLLPQATLKQLDRALGEYGVPLAALEGFKPNLVTQQLTVLQLSSVGAAATLGMEAHFRRKLRAEQRILELETLEQQLDVLLNAPLDTQIELTELFMAQLDRADELNSGLISAWMAGDDQAFQSIVELQQGDSAKVRRFHRRLIEDRNLTMAAAIDRLVGNEPGVFYVLVGAAHMLGSQGIPSELERHGFKGSRLTTASQL